MEEAGEDIKMEEKTGEEEAMEEEGGEMRRRVGMADRKRKIIQRAGWSGKEYYSFGCAEYNASPFGPKCHRKADRWWWMDDIENGIKIKINDGDRWQCNQFEFVSA